MKRTVLVIFVVLITFNVTFSQCPEYLLIESQDQIDNFPINYPNCSEIDLFVTISGNDISNLSGLSNLTSIGTYLTIENTLILQNLTGLDNLSSVGIGIIIKDNSGLINLNGLENITSGNEAFSLYIERNENLTSLSGLNNIYCIPGDLFIIENYSLVNLSGLESLNSVDTWFVLIDNANLSSLSGLENMNSVNDFHIGNNNSLINLSGLNALSIITEGLIIIGNDSLNSLSGLEGLISISYSLTIEDNSSLINNLNGLNNLSTVGKDLVIRNNYLLQSLIGINNLDAVGRDLRIINCNSLVDLHGLGNIKSIGGAMNIDQNNALLSLSGIDSIAAESISDLSITYNPFLSYCEVKSVCDYLASPNGNTSIYVNTNDCNNSQEVINACLVSQKENYETIKLECFPNPTRNILNILNPSKIQVQLIIYNQLGQQVLSYTGIIERVDISKLQKGLYYAELSSNGLRITEKIIIN